MSWRAWLGGLFPSERKSETSPGGENATSQVIKLSEHDKISVLPLYEWVVSNASPYAWDRIIMRCVNDVLAERIQLRQIIAPTSDMVIPGALANLLVSTLMELYGI
ncbi:MAG: hypothetical protein RMJ66_01525, partial [Bacteroidia bacterium]|nr:hypothetical protein [Bacteroidia bacterium]